MESKKISGEEKEKLQEMLQGQRERGYERMVQAGQRLEEDQQAALIGGGRRWFAIILLLLGGMNIFFGVQGLRTLNRLTSLPPQTLIVVTVICFIVLGWGVILFAVGILNFVIRHFKMLLINGIFLIVSSLINFLGGNPIGVIPLAVGIYFIYRYSKTVKFMRSRETE